MSIQQTKDKPRLYKRNGKWQVANGLAGSHKWDFALAYLAAIRLNHIDKVKS